MNMRADRSIPRAWRYAAFVCGLTVATVIAGCQAGRGGSGVRTQSSTARRSRQNPIVRVVCLYDQKPWLNLDAAGDRDPEGIHFRVFLDAGGGKGVFRDGVFHVEMYRIDRQSPGEIQRTLVSDWEYPTSSFQRVQSKVLGTGYHLRLRWATKDIAGTEIEVITQFRDVDGTVVRSDTKRARVPKYTS